MEDFIAADTLERLDRSHRDRSGITFAELGSESCRFPLGDHYPYRFCGEQKLPGSSYCLGHDLLCCRRVK